jgi:hypothetical protein
MSYGTRAYDKPNDAGFPRQQGGQAFTGEES